MNGTLPPCVPLVLNASDCDFWSPGLIHVLDIDQQERSLATALGGYCARLEYVRGLAARNIGSWMVNGLGNDMNCIQYSVGNAQYYPAPAFETFKPSLRDCFFALPKTFGIDSSQCQPSIPWFFFSKWENA